MFVEQMSVDRKTPKLWEAARDKTLTSFVFHIEGKEYSLRQSTYLPSLWFAVQVPCALRPRTIRLLNDCDLPDVSDSGEHKHIAAFLVYVDDFFAARPRDVLQRRLRVWRGSNPDFLGDMVQKNCWPKQLMGTKMRVFSLPDTNRVRQVLQKKNHFSFCHVWTTTIKTLFL